MFEETHELHLQQFATHLEAILKHLFDVRNDELTNKPTTPFENNPLLKHDQRCTHRVLHHNNILYASC